MTFWRGWADEAAGLLSKNGFLPLDGVLADFGLSHDQLDDPSRGFSFRFPDSPLDMRFDPEGPATAAGILNGTDIEGYRALLAEGGVARGAEALARRLSASGPFQTVGDLVAVAGPRRGRIHPATVLFQAVRMKVNREIERIRRLLAQIPGWLRPGGRAVFLSYHSVEDRLVKQALRGGLPGLEARPRKALKPSREEARLHPPARSARLRCAEKAAA
jgi:16S rRNA (cytosine1402-N4)-methyltransferase